MRKHFYCHVDGSVCLSTPHPRKCLLKSLIFTGNVSDAVNVEFIRTL